MPPEDVAETVTAPVAPETVMLGPATIEVTPVFWTTTAPVVGEAEMPAPEAVTDETAPEAVEFTVTSPVPPDGLIVTFVPAIMEDTPETKDWFAIFGESTPLCV
jgi:hypothetical protein